MSSRTPNINLEKPSSDENYSIAVFNGNSDTIDTEMALRVKTADIINNLTSTATNKPLSAAQGKKLQDEKVAISSIVNNLTSTATNAPLSAAQGKSLSDTIAAKTKSALYITSGTIISKLQTENITNGNENVWFFAGSGVTDLPTSESFLIRANFSNASGHTVVKAEKVNSNNGSDIYIRDAYITASDSHWYDASWRKLATDNIRRMSNIDTDFDKAHGSSVETCTFGSNTSGNKPFTDGFVTTYVWNENYQLQVACDDDTDVFMFRRHPNASWTAWQKLVTEGSATAIKYTGPVNGGVQIQVARTGSRVYRVSMFRNASASVAVVDQWGAVAYVVNTASFVVTADSTNITIKNNSGAYCNVVVEEM